MTTKAAENLYRAQHEHRMEGKRPAIYNPEKRQETDLPVIYGFNNGGSAGWLEAILISEDGVVLGSHLCSHEAYMPNDLGILEGTRPDRHETFKQHYPAGYRMEFINNENTKTHKGLDQAFKLLEKKNPPPEATDEMDQEGSGSA